MKCLLCNFTSKDKSKIENHYINFHNVDRENIFLEDYSIRRTMFFLVKNV